MSNRNKLFLNIFHKKKEKEIDNKLNYTNKISYYLCNNFGDAVGPLLFDFLSSIKLYHEEIKPKNLSFLTVGSILNHGCNKHIILGSGFISETDKFKGNSKPSIVLLVRGPKTREKLLNLGVRCPESYGDPLILFPLLYCPSFNKVYDIGIIPHYIDMNTINFNKLKQKLIDTNFNVKIIDIMTGIKYHNFIDEINKCEYIISSSLHCVIMGIVYGKKTIFTQLSDKVIGNLFKFQDFFDSLDIKYKVINWDSNELLNNVITIDTKKLENIGNNIINVCPFIEKDKKLVFINKWFDHINKYFPHKCF
jgi:pyruvyltransferase